MIARTFRNMSRLVTTSRGGPPLRDVDRIIFRSLKNGKVIDDCVVDDVPDSVLNRYLLYPQDAHVELVVKGALEMYRVKNADLEWPKERRFDDMVGSNFNQDGVWTSRGMTPPPARPGTLARGTSASESGS